MITSEEYMESQRNKPYQELITERNRLIRNLQTYEKYHGVEHCESNDMGDIQKAENNYQIKLKKLEKLCLLISQIHKKKGTALKSQQEEHDTESNSGETDYSKYQVYAKFSNNNKKRILADIVYTGEDQNRDDSDVFFVMINPGSCSVAKENREVTDYQVEGIKGKVVYAQSDPAQKCIMQFMEHCKIRKVRILNLLDDVEPKLEQFKKISEKDEGVLQESIFSESRKSELEALMPDYARCVIAWGLDASLDDLKQQAMRKLLRKNVQIIGLQSEPNLLAYRYIKPHTVQDQKHVIEALAKLWKETSWD